jgi:hypothetical protein
MTRTSRGGFASTWASILGLLCLARPAYAESNHRKDVGVPETVAATPTVTTSPTALQRDDRVAVRLEAPNRDDAPVRIYPPGAKPGRDPAIESCRLPCEVQVRPGRYLIQVVETRKSLGGEREVTTSKPSTVVVSPGDRSTRSTGLVLAVSGLVSLAVGGTLIATSSRADSEGGGPGMLPGLLLMLAGAVLTPVGFVVYGDSTPGVRVIPEQSASAPRARVGIVVAPGAVALSGNFVF